MTTSPSVDVVVLNYNGKRFLDDCFQSLRKTNYPNYKVYLLDNASTENDIEYVKQNYPEAEVIAVNPNKGYCGAYNIGFKHCKGKYFVCLNNDVTVDPDWITHMVELAESDEKIAAIQPKLRSMMEPHKLEYAGAAGGMMDKYGYPFCRGRLFDTVEEDKGQYDDNAEIFWASGAALFVRKSALEVTGDFDETIAHHMDEIDLCWRFILMGYTCRVAYKSIIYHFGGGTIQTASYKKMYWNHRNSIYLMLKNFSTYNRITKTFVHILLDYVAVLQSIFSGDLTRARAIKDAHWWLLTNSAIISQKKKHIQSTRKVDDAAVLKTMYPKSVVLQHFLWKKMKYSEL